MDSEPRGVHLIISLVILVIFVLGPLVQAWRRRRTEGAAEAIEPEPSSATEDDSDVWEVSPEEERGALPAEPPDTPLVRPARPSLPRPERTSGQRRDEAPAAEGMRAGPPGVPRLQAWLFGSARWSPAAKLVISSEILGRPRFLRMLQPPKAPRGLQGPRAT